MEGMGISYRILIGYSEGKGPLILLNNIKMDVRELRWEGVERSKGDQ
jgi:hypothetical protein